jgi:hypothetical protein
MSNKIYYFEVPDPEGEVEQRKLKKIFANNLNQKDDELIFFVDAKKSNNIFYTLWSTSKVERIVQELKILGVVFLYKDITEQVLIGTQFNDVEFSKIFSKVKNKKQLDLFLRSNLTKDDVLDKINIQGIEALTAIDKEVLGK